jgi:hypothetical protein
MKLIIDEFKIEGEQKMKLHSYPTNLYRDNDAKMTIQAFI